MSGEEGSIGKRGEVHVLEERAPELEGAARAGKPSSRFAPDEESLPPVARLEERLTQIRDLLDTAEREQRHKEFSAARLTGALAQALVVALLAWALSDWVFALPPETVLVKLGFAAVLQLAALTAFVVGREGR